MPDDVENLGVLRVLCSFPAKPHMKTVKQHANAEKSNYVATLDVKRLAEHPKDLQIMESMERQLVDASLSKKRKLGEDQEKRKHAKRKTQVLYFIGILISHFLMIITIALVCTVVIH